MLVIKNSVCIESSSETVWAALADLEKVTVWVDPILDARCLGTSSGVGAVRVCRLKGNVHIREQWVEWDEGKSFSYLADGVPLIKYAKNSWKVEDVNGMCLVTSCAEFMFKGGGFGLPLELLIGRLMKRMGPRTLAGFKYWIENGQPYQGNIGELPIAPISC